MALNSESIGRRFVVRHVIPGLGPTGGPAMTDVVGRVVTFDTTSVRLERRDGSEVSIELASIVITKPVPDAPIRSRGAMAISAANLTRITSRGWPAIESEALGDWELRAADGFTGRANSVTVHGDPGVPFEAALTTACAFYSARNQRPLAQVIVGSEHESAFLAAGWVPISGYSAAIVQVARLRENFVTEGVTTDAEPSQTWLGRYQRVGDAEAAARAVLTGPNSVAFLSIGSPMTAIGRVAVTGEWAGIGCIEVVPEQRCQGLGRRIVEAGLDWAHRHGADKAYLQTRSDNAAALALYAPYGFQTHHEYVYLTPGPSAQR